MDLIEYENRSKSVANIAFPSKSKYCSRFANHNKDVTFGLHLRFCGKVMCCCKFVVHLHMDHYGHRYVFEPFLHMVQTTEL